MLIVVKFYSGRRLVRIVLSVLNHIFHISTSKGKSHRAIGQNYGPPNDDLATFRKLTFIGMITSEED